MDPGSLRNHFRINHAPTLIMNNTKQKLRSGQPVFGGWLMTGNPAVAEIMAAEGFDFIGVDMEHTPTNVEGFYHIALATKGTGCDVLARLPSCDPVLAKQVLDMGAAGFIVPSVNSPNTSSPTSACDRVSKPRRSPRDAGRGRRASTTC